MGRHPAREFAITDGVLIDQNAENLTPEEKLFFQFRDDARDTDAQPDFLIWRLNIDPRTDKPRSSDPGAFCTDTPMDSFKSFNELLSWIRDTYGAGYFRVTGRMRSADGTEKTYFNRVVRIAAPVDKPGTELKDTGNDFSKMLAAIHAMNAQSEKNMENMLRMVANMSQRRDESPPMNPEKIMQWVAAGAALLGQMKGLFSPPVSQVGGLASMIQEFKGIQELLGQTANPGNDTNDSDVMNTLIKTFGPVIAHMVVQGQQGKPAAPAALPNPIATPAHTSPPVREAQSNDMNPLLITFRNNIHQLIAQAKAGTPAAAVANFVLDSNDEDKIDQLVELCERGDAIDQIIALVPEAADHREWLEAFRLAIVNAYADEDTDEPPATN